MNKLLKVTAVGGLVAMSLGLSGCQNATNNNPAAQGKAPEVVLQEGVSKLANVTSYNYTVGLNADVKAPSNAEAGSPQSVKFNITADGGIDMKDVKDPRLNLHLKGDMSADQDGGNAEFSFRMTKEAMYANLAKLEGKGQFQIPNEMVSQYIGKWWTMPVPASALEELAKSVPQGDAATMTPEQKQMKELVQSTKFFKNVEFKNVEKVGGEDSSHYTAVLDKDAFVAFAEKAAALQGTKMTDSEKADMTKAMSLVDFSGDVYIGNTSGVLNKVHGTLTLKSDSKTPSPTGTVTFDGSITDLNKPVTVEVPKDAQPMPAELVGGLL